MYITDKSADRVGLATDAIYAIARSRIGAETVLAKVDAIDEIRIVAVVGCRRGCRMRLGRRCGADHTHRQRRSCKATATRRIVLCTWVQQLDLARRHTSCQRLLFILMVKTVIESINQSIKS